MSEIAVKMIPKEATVREHDTPHFENTSQPIHRKDENSFV